MSDGDLLSGNQNQGFRLADLDCVKKAREAQSQAAPGDVYVQGFHGRTDTPSVQGQPAQRFGEGRPDPEIPDTKNRIRENADGTVEGLPHMQPVAPVAIDPQQTMEQEAAKAEARARKKNHTQTPEEIAQDNANKKMTVSLLEQDIKDHLDWAPDVLTNDAWGAAGGAAAVAVVSMLFKRGPVTWANSIATVANLAKGAAAGTALTGGIQMVANDQIDKHAFHKDHGFELKWVSDGMVMPAALCMSAKVIGNGAAKPLAGQIVGDVLALPAHYAAAKFNSLGTPTALAAEARCASLATRLTTIGGFVGKSAAFSGRLAVAAVPLALGAAAVVGMRLLDKGTGTEGRNPTYSKWCQESWWDSAAMTFASGYAFLKRPLTGRIHAPGKAGVALSVAEGLGAAALVWTGSRLWNNANPHPSPSDDFTKAMTVIDKDQVERSGDTSSALIKHMKDFGNYGRQDLLKFRRNAVSTVPALYQYAELFPHSEHARPGYVGAFTHAKINFAAGDRGLKWGSIGVDMPMGDSIGQDMKIDLGGEAMRKLIAARQEVNDCLVYANKHKGQVPGGDKSGKPIDDKEITDLEQLGARIDSSLNEINSGHGENLQKIMGQLQDRIFKMDTKPIYTLRAMTKELALHPKIDDPVYTPMFRAKMMRDLALMNLAIADLDAERQLRYGQALVKKGLQQDSVTSFLAENMPKRSAYFAEALDCLTWAKTQMPKGDPGYEDMLAIENIARGVAKKLSQGDPSLTPVLQRYIARYQVGDKIDISPDLTSIFAINAANRNGRNPTDDLNPQEETAPTPQEVEREKRSQETYQTKEQAQEHEAAENRTANEANQKAAELKAAQRQIFANENGPEYLSRFISVYHRAPTPQEREALRLSLQTRFDELDAQGLIDAYGKEIKPGQPAQPTYQPAYQPPTYQPPQQTEQPKEPIFQRAPVSPSSPIMQFEPPDQ